MLILQVLILQQLKISDIHLSCLSKTIHFQEIWHILKEMRSISKEVKITFIKPI